jgi:hypothetical protein
MQIAGQRHIITPLSLYKVMSDQDKAKNKTTPQRRNRTQCQIGKEESS